MQNKLYKKSIGLMVITIICQLINLFRDILLARTYGATSINDVYLVSQTIISVSVSMVNSPMATAFVPVAAKFDAKDMVIQKNVFVSKVYSNIIVISIGMMFVELWAIDGIVKIAAPGFDVELNILLKRLVMIQLPTVIISLIKGVNRGNFQMMQKFGISEIGNAFPYLCMCIYLLLPVKKNIYAISVILTVGAIISLLPELYILYRNGFRFKFCPGMDDDIRSLGCIMATAAITSAIREINVMFDKAIGSFLPTGSITMLSYSSKLTVVIVGLISTSISVVGFTNIAKYRSQNKKEKVKEEIINACNLMNFLIIPIAFSLIIFSYDIVKLLYYGSSFDLNSVKKTSQLMKLYAVGLIGYGFQDIYTRTLHAYKIVRCTLKESFIMVVVNISLSMALLRFIGEYGVAIATSISVLIVIPILGRDVRKNVIEFSHKDIWNGMWKTCVAAAIDSVIVIAIKAIVKSDATELFLAELLGGVCIYFILCLFIKHPVLMNFAYEKH